MKEFMMLFRSETGKEEEFANQPPEQMKAVMARWDEWLGGIAAQDKLLGTNALNHLGKIVQADGSVTDGPYVALKEMVGGYTMVKAENFDEAVALTKGCPMFDMGGTVEVRDIIVYER